MTSTVQTFLESFQRLTEDERREATREILHLTTEVDNGLLDDEAFDRLAEEAFLEYDVREAADGGR